MTKRCSRCGKEKSLDAFRVDHRRDKPVAECRACARKHGRAFYAENRESLRALRRDRRAGNPERERERRQVFYNENRERELERKMAYCAENPEKHLAHSAISKGIRDGRIARPDSCSKCDRACTPQGHHEDYSKQLDVIWLCASCHGRHHAGV